MGLLGYDVSAHAPNQTPLALRSSRSARQGLGNHAPGRIVVDLTGATPRLMRRLAFRTRTPPTAAWSSACSSTQEGLRERVMRQDTPAMPVHVSVLGAQELRLEAGDAGDGINCDCADWAEAR